jgi:hypothetical protein
MPAFAAVETLIRKHKSCRCTPDDVHPLQQAATPSKEDFDNSPHYPLVMTPDPMALSDGQVAELAAVAACSSSRTLCP